MSLELSYEYHLKYLSSILNSSLISTYTSEQSKSGLLTWVPVTTLHPIPIILRRQHRVPFKWWHCPWYFGGFRHLKFLKTSSMLSILSNSEDESQFPRIIPRSPSEFTYVLFLILFVKIITHLHNFLITWTALLLLEYLSWFIISTPAIMQSYEDCNIFNK